MSFVRRTVCLTRPTSRLLAPRLAYAAPSASCLPSRFVSSYTFPKNQKAMSLSTNATQRDEMGASMGGHSNMQGMSGIDMIINEHRRVDKLFDQFKNGLNAESKQTTAFLIIKELSLHAAKEEMVVYPLMRQKIGSQFADHGLEEHHTVKQLLYELDNMKATDPGFDEKMRLVMDNVTHHVKEEEQEMLPKLASTMTTEELIELGRSFMAAESAAPSRPHPSAPDKPPMNYAANIAAKGMDAIKDSSRFANLPKAVDKEEL